MTTNTPIRILVVDDSLVFCKFLVESIPKLNSRFEVVGYAMNTRQALQKVEALKPDIISLDVEMPGESGIDFLKRLLPLHPIPVILVSSLNLNVFEALGHGAVDFLHKPDMTSGNRADMFLQSLGNKLLLATYAKVRIPRSVAPTPAVPASSPARTANTLGGSPLPLDRLIIAIGASTGGTEATLEVLRNLPANTPGIVVTQHMPEGFTKMYAERLDRLCQMRVKEACHGDRIMRGQVLIAPGSLQMRVVRVGSTFTVNCFDGPKVNGHRPSVDVLFDSVAATAGPEAVGIILTGMGGDGAKGLLKMRQAGAFTIGQDKESCVVYGMPMVAHNLGAVAVQAACSNIPHVLLNYLNTGKGK